jgi:hypothetical protein
MKYFLRSFALYLCCCMYRSFSSLQKWRQQVLVNCFTVCPGTNDAVAGLCSGKFNVAYCSDPTWKTINTTTIITKDLPLKLGEVQLFTFATQHLKPAVAGSVWLSRFMDGTGKCMLPGSIKQSLQKFQFCRVGLSLGILISLYFTVYAPTPPAPSITLKYPPGTFWVIVVQLKYLLNSSHIFNKKKLEINYL